jgi:hypothetical protein
VGCEVRKGRKVSFYFKGKEGKGGDNNMEGKYFFTLRERRACAGCEVVV